MKEGALHELPGGWVWTRLGEICFIRDRDHKTPRYLEKGIPLISPKCFTPSGIDFTELNYVGNDELINFKKKCNPSVGDILFSRIGTIGKARLVDFELEFVALHSIAMVKPN
jgi:type I restriction enzyme S subunit